VGGRSVAGDADPGRGDSPGGGKNGGLNPGGLLSAIASSGEHTEIQVVVRQVVTLEEAYPYQEEGIYLISLRFGSYANFTYPGKGGGIPIGGNPGIPGGGKGLEPGC
jgi:hypothetical protein